MTRKCKHWQSKFSGCRICFSIDISASSGVEVTIASSPYIVMPLLATLAGSLVQTSVYSGPKSTGRGSSCLWRCFRLHNAAFQPESQCQVGLTVFGTSIIKYFLKNENDLINNGVYGRSREMTCFLEPLSSFRISASTEEKKKIHCDVCVDGGKVGSHFL